MSQSKSKKDRILDLETRLAAHNALIRSLGGAMGVEVGDDIDVHNLPRYVQRFNAALARLRDDQGDEHGGVPDALGGQSLQTFDKLVDREINALGLARQPGADPSASEDAAWIEAVGAELGLPPGRTSPAEIHEAIRRLKDPTTEDPALAKGDSLVEAMAHNANMRSHLEQEVAAVRLVVNRIASVLQVPRFDRDGTEILEKVQRWEGFKYALRQRRLDLLRSADTEPPTKDAVVKELEYLMTFLLAPSTLAEWVKMRPGVAGPVILANVESPAAVKEFQDFKPEDLARLFKSVQGVTILGTKDEDYTRLAALMAAVIGSLTASAEMVRLMNLVVIPLLNRQHFAQMVAPQN